MRFVVLLLSLAAVGGCGGPSASCRAIGGPPKSMDFELLRDAGDAQIKAWFRDDHSRVLGIDLVRSFNVLPIWVQVDVDDNAKESVKIDPEQMDFMLFLQDGAALRPMSGRDIKELVKAHGANAQTLNAVRTEQLQSMYIGKGDRNNGFVFFEMPSGADFIVGRDMTVQRSDRGYTTSVDLRRSLIRFRLNGGTQSNVFLGLEVR